MKYLLVNHPLPYASKVCTQISAFYFPGQVKKIPRKNDIDFYSLYQNSVNVTTHLDLAIRTHPLKGESSTTFDITEKYLGWLKEHDTKTGLPLFCSFGYHFLYHYIDWLFLFSMIGALFIIFIRQTKYSIFLPLLYVLIFLYAFTIALIHTFDVSRFSDTVYPLLLTSTACSVAFIIANIGSLLTNLFKKKN